MVAEFIEVVAEPVEVVAEFIEVVAEPVEVAARQMLSCCKLAFITLLLF